MSDIEIDNTPECIDALIKKQENYPYFYWVIWILFLALFAGVLGVRACQELKLNTQHVQTTKQPESYTSVETKVYKEFINKTQLEQNFMMKIRNTHRQIVSN